MIHWFAANLGTILISLVLIGAIAGILINLKKKKQSGESTCGCGCSNCAMNGACHPK